MVTYFYVEYQPPSEWYLTVHIIKFQRNTINLLKKGICFKCFMHKHILCIIIVIIKLNKRQLKDIEIEKVFVQFWIKEKSD